MAVGEHGGPTLASSHGSGAPAYKPSGEASVRDRADTVNTRCPVILRALNGCANAPPRLQQVARVGTACGAVLVLDWLASH